jgi:hypothetical protein
MLKTKTSPPRSEPGNVLRTSAKQLQSAALATRYQSSTSVSAPGCLAVSEARILEIQRQPEHTATGIVMNPVN